PRPAGRPATGPGTPVPCRRCPAWQASGTCQSAEDPRAEATARAESPRLRWFLQPHTLPSPDSARSCRIRSASRRMDSGTCAHGTGRAQARQAPAGEIMAAAVKDHPSRAGRSAGAGFPVYVGPEGLGYRSASGCRRRGRGKSAGPDPGHRLARLPRPKPAGCARSSRRTPTPASPAQSAAATAPPCHVASARRPESAGAGSDSAVIGAAPRHRTCDESSGWALSCLVVDEVAGRNAEFAGELSEALAPGFQAGTEELENLPLMVFDCPRGQVASHGYVKVGHAGLQENQRVLESV